MTAPFLPLRDRPVVPKPFLHDILGASDHELGIVIRYTSRGLPKVFARPGLRVRGMGAVAFELQPLLDWLADHWIDYNGELEVAIRRSALTVEEFNRQVRESIEAAFGSAPAT